jgi:hypothetical protein
MAYQSSRTGAQVDSALDNADSALQASHDTDARHVVVGEKTQWDAAYAHSQTTGNAHSLTLLDIGAAAAVHGHAVSDVVGLQGLLDAKAASVHVHAIADVTGLQAALDGKAATSHTHTIANVTGLQAALDGKADTAHTHTGVYEPAGTAATAVGTHESTYDHTLIATALQPGDTLNADTIKDKPVTADALADGHILVYRTASQEWEVEAKPASGANPAAGDVSVSGTPSNYSAATADVQAHLEGIDDALQPYYPPRATKTAAASTDFVLDGTAYTCQLDANITTLTASLPSGGNAASFEYGCRIDFTPPASGTFTVTIPGTGWEQAGPLDAISLSDTDVGILMILSTKADGTIIYTAQELT